MMTHHTVPDEDGDFLFIVMTDISAGQMIFTIRKYDKRTGDIVSNESHIENRFYAKPAKGC